MLPHAEMRPQTQMVIMMMWTCKKNNHTSAVHSVYHRPYFLFCKSSGSDVISYLTTNFLLSSVQQWKTPGELRKPHHDLHAPGCFNTLSICSFTLHADLTPPPLPPKVGIYVFPLKNEMTVTPTLLNTFARVRFCAAQSPDELRGKRGRGGWPAEEVGRPAAPLPSHQDLQRDSCQTHLPAKILAQLRCMSSPLSCFKKKIHLHAVQLIVFLLCGPDPTTFPVQDSDRSADLIPPELPPKGIRRRQPISKVKNIIITWRRIYKSAALIAENWGRDSFALRNLQNVSAPAWKSLRWVSLSQPLNRVI